MHSVVITVVSCYLVAMIIKKRVWLMDIVKE